MSEPRPSPLFS